MASEASRGAAAPRRAVAQPEAATGVVRALVPAVLLLALGVASLAMVFDLGSRMVSISAVPVLVALHFRAIALGLVLVLLACLVVEDADARPGSAVRLLTAAVALAAMVVVAAQQPVLGPAPLPGALLLVVAPAALGAEAIARRRRALSRRTARITALLVVVAGSLAAGYLASGRYDAGAVDARPLELAIAGGAIAVAGAVLVAGRRPRVRLARLAEAAIVLAGLAVVVLGRSQFPAVGIEGDGGSVVAIAVLAVVLALSTVGRVRRRASALIGSSGAGRAVASTRRGVLRLADPRPVAAAGRRTLAALAPASLRSSSSAPGDRALAAAMAVLSFGYLAAGVAWAFRAGWEPTAHAATVLARAGDVGTADHPLTGIVTSIGAASVSHPGPLLYDVLAPLVRVLGLRPAALVGGALVSGGSWALMVWSAWRAAGRGAAVGAWVLGGAVLVVAAGGAVWEANNATASLLATTATVLACWAVTCGVLRAWPWAVVFGSFCIQAYLPHGLLPVVPLLWAGLAVLGARWSLAVPADARRAVRTWRWGLVVALVLWAQPLLDAALNDGGNLRDLAQLSGNGPAVIGRSAALGAIAWIFAIPPRWFEIGGSFAQVELIGEVLGTRRLGGLLVALLWIAGMAWGWRRAPVAHRRLTLMTTSVVVTAAAAATRLPAEEIRAYTLMWMTMTSLLVWFTTGLHVVRAVREGVRARGAASSTPRRAGRPVVAVAALGFGALVLVHGALTPPDRIEDFKGAEFTIDTMVRELVDETLRGYRGPEPVLVLPLDTRFGESTADTLISNLLTEGVDVRVEPVGGLNYGRRRVAPPRWTGPALLVTTSLPPISPEGRRIAAASVPGWSSARFDRVADEVATAVATGGLELSSEAAPQLVGYLAGWVDDPCARAAAILGGKAPLEDLPAGALASLYADRGLVGPGLDLALRERAGAVVGQAPVEVWEVALEDVPPYGGQLLRDLSVCPTAAASNAAGGD